MWVVILAVDLGNREKWATTTANASQRTSEDAKADVITMWARPAEVARLIEPFDVPTAEPLKPRLPRPRSEQRQGILLA